MTNWNYAAAGDTTYGFTGSGDSPAYARDASWQITEKYLSLPGGITLTIRPTETDANKKKTYSLRNIHGDTLATTNASGVNTSTGSGPSGVYLYDPFGGPVTSATPNNTSPGTSNAYAGSFKRSTETDFQVSLIQMGARVYVPILARFLQVDPIEGGTANAYVYALDPVNGNDYSGQFSIATLITVVKVVVAVVKQVVQSGGISKSTLQALSYRPPAASANATLPPGIPMPKDLISPSPNPLPLLQYVNDPNTPRPPLGPSIKVDQFYFYNAYGTSYSYMQGGSLVVGSAACAAGAVFTFALGGIGCYPAAAVGSALGAGVGAITGFFLGGHGSNHSGDFDWGPDAVSRPW